MRRSGAPSQRGGNQPPLKKTKFIAPLRKPIANNASSACNSTSVLSTHDLSDNPVSAMKVVVTESSETTTGNDTNSSNTTSVQQKDQLTSSMLASSNMYRGTNPPLCDSDVDFLAKMGIELNDSLSQDDSSLVDCPSMGRMYGDSRIIQGTNSCPEAIPVVTTKPVKKFCPPPMRAANAFAARGVAGRQPLVDRNCGTGCEGNHDFIAIA